MIQHIEIKSIDVTSKDAKIMMKELNLELFKITGNSGAGSFDEKELNNPRSIFLVAYLNGEPMACGALKEVSNGTAEIKRVYARKNQLGLATKLVKKLENYAITFGYSMLRLETRKINKHAVNFYLNNEYEICDNYGKYEGREEAICFYKRLV